MGRRTSPSPSLERKGRISATENRLARVTPGIKPFPRKVKSEGLKREAGAR